MFTGIVKELGIVRRIECAGGQYRLDIESRRLSEGVRIGDSISVNGACLTVTGKSGKVISFDVMAETLRRTALVELNLREAVNLEGALKAGETLDGHFVLGHIDCVGVVRRCGGRQGEHEIEIEFPEEHDKLLVEKGSVAVDGVSLTIGALRQGRFSVYLIPHTLRETTLDSKKAGSLVNIEFDIVGKYVAKLNAKDRPGITEDFLKSNGF